MTPTDYARVHRVDALDRLTAFLRIASVSAAPEHATDMRQAACWVAERLRDAGMETVRVDETRGHPVVFAHRTVAPNAPTVLVYGHYDVQPPEPLEQWVTPPFEPTERDGALYARGASDDKGQLLAHIEAAAAFHHTAGAPPVNLTYVIEGEEEIGSPSLPRWLAEHRGQAAADVAVISDTAIVGRDQPSIVYGLRGLAYLEIDIAGPSHDLHSGQFGGGVHNPADALCRIVAALHDTDGRVSIPGFYDRVRPLSDDERTELARVPFDTAAFRAAAGAAGGWGEPGYSTVERLGARPTLDVNGLWSGWTGTGAKTVLPATAHAKVSMRLVPDQDPDDINQLFSAHIARIAPPDVTVVVRSLHGARPVRIDRGIPAVRAAARAYERGFGRAPVFSLEGGSIPVVALLKEQLGLDTVLMGFGLPDDNLHAPNEKIDLAQFRQGVDTVIAFLEELAGAPTIVDPR
jgi:acetylornithine deacetylase/succinyl-diaminopimelate desuccinylase-like protein